MIPSRFTPFARGAAYDAAALTWFAAVVTAGGTVSPTRKGYVDTLIKGLKADSVWSKLDCLWLFAAENTQSALLDLVGLRTASPGGAPTFTTDRGYAGDGSSTYINTTWNPSTHGVAYTLNSAHLMLYNRTARTDTGSSTSNAGAVVSGNYAQIYCRYATSSGLDLNDAVGGSFSAPADASGIWVASRTSSNTMAMYRNGSSLFSSGALSSTSVPNAALFVGGWNSGGSLGRPTSDEHAAFSAGGALNSTEAAALTTRVRDYMNSVGA